MYYAVDTTVSALQLDGCSSAVPAPRQQGCYAVDTTVSALQLDGCSSAVPAPRQQGCLLLLSSRGVINYLALCQNHSGSKQSHFVNVLWQSFRHRSTPYVVKQPPKN